MSLQEKSEALREKVGQLIFIREAETERVVRFFHSVAGGVLRSSLKRKEERLNRVIAEKLAKVVVDG